MNNWAVKTNSNSAATFFICTLAAALLGFLSGFFSDAFSNLILDEWLAALLYALVCLLSGLTLYSILTTQTKNRTYSLIKSWAVLIWFAQFTMFLLSPFFTGTLAYAWLSIIASLITALAVLCFKLRFFGAISLLPVLAWIIFSSYAVLSVI